MWSFKKYKQEPNFSDLKNRFINFLSYFFRSLFPIYLRTAACSLLSIVLHHNHTISAEMAHWDRWWLGHFQDCLPYTLLHASLSVNSVWLWVFAWSLTSSRIALTLCFLKCFLKVKLRKKFYSSFTGLLNNSYFFGGVGCLAVPIPHEF